jgi:hypothetical protein
MNLSLLKKISISLAIIKSALAFIILTQSEKQYAQKRVDYAKH